MNHATPDYETIGNVIKALRNGKNWTQKELAQKLGISFQSVSKWERGEVISLENLSAVADLFDVSLDYLMGRSKYRTMEQDAIGKMTGLSAEVVDKICKYNEKFQKGSILTTVTTSLFSRVDLINCLLKSDDYEKAAEAFSQLCEAYLLKELAHQNVGPVALNVFDELPYRVRRDQDGNLIEVELDTYLQHDIMERKTGVMADRKAVLMETFTAIINHAVKELVNKEMIEGKKAEACEQYGGITNKELIAEGVKAGILMRGPDGGYVLLIR